TQATMAAHMTDTAAPVESERAATPPALAQLVSQCLAKSDADRPQQAAELVSVLDSVATPVGSPPLAPTASAVGRRMPSSVRLSLVAGAAMLIGVGGWVAWKTLRPTPLDRHRVAVVPFANLTGDSSLAVVGRVAAEELSRSISQTDSADVVS